MKILPRLKEMDSPFTGEEFYLFSANAFPVYFKLNCLTLTVWSLMVEEGLGELIAREGEGVSLYNRDENRTLGRPAPWYSGMGVGCWVGKSTDLLACAEKCLEVSRVPR